MRRKAGALVPLEETILSIGVALRASRDPEFHGFAMAKLIQEADAARRLTAHGTLYKALARMEKAGLLESRWEDAAVAAEEQRPRRRFYRVTAQGEAALARVRAPAPRKALRAGLAPS